MGEYEIRILKADRTPSLIYACSHVSDAAAIGNAGNIQRDPGDSIEVWRGTSCIHRDDGLRILPGLRRQEGRLPQPFTDRAISNG
jgi:hypothetical protein